MANSRLERSRSRNTRPISRPSPVGLARDRPGRSADHDDPRIVQAEIGLAEILFPQSEIVPIRIH